MNDLILNIVRFNEQVDFNIIIPFVILYVLAFWVIVSIWVFLDSKLRYGSRKKALLLAILNQIFGLPFLLLYILARPFIPEEQSGDHLSAVENGGVNVPIVNFTGKDGVVMSLQLSINSPTLVSNTQNSEMTIDVSFNSTDADKVLVEKTQKPKELEFKESKAARFAGKIRSLFRKKESTLQLEKEVPDTTVSDMEIKISESNKAKKKKNKKKRK
jgi:hypothetical protein